MPPVPQHLQHVGRLRHAAALGALALLDADAHAVGAAVDVDRAQRVQQVGLHLLGTQLLGAASVALGQARDRIDVSLSRSLRQATKLQRVERALA